MGEIPVKPSPVRVWGEIATPKGFLGTLQTIPLAKNPGKPHGGPGGWVARIRNKVSKDLAKASGILGTP